MAGSNILKSGDADRIKLTDAGLSSVLAVVFKEGKKKRKESYIYWMAPEIIDENPGDYETSADMWYDYFVATLSEVCMHDSQHASIITVGHRLIIFCGFKVL